MELSVAQLEPNPFRNVGRYPISKTKVKALEISIKETSFWNNIIARKHGKAYQIAYGHHRLAALKNLDIKTVDIPVMDLNDVQMLKIMANENLDDWSTSPAIINETVLTAKKFLDGELAKYEWKDCVGSVRVFFDSEHAYNQAKNKPDGVGRDTLSKCLGGNWKSWVVREALNTIKESGMTGPINKDAVDMIPNLEQARRFKQEVKRCGIPKSVQVSVAKKIRDNKESSRSIPEIVEDYAPPMKKSKPLDPERPVHPMLDERIKKMLLAGGSVSSVIHDLCAVGGFLKHIQDVGLHDGFLLRLEEVNRITREILSVEKYRGGLKIISGQQDVPNFRPNDDVSQKPADSQLAAEV